MNPLNKLFLQMFRFLSILALIVAPISWSGTYQSPLVPSQIVYSASYNGLPIKVIRELKSADGRSFSVTSTAENILGRIEESGTFQLAEDKSLENRQYVYQRNVFGNQKKEQLTFDYEDNFAIYQSDDKRRKVVLDKPYHSRMSYQVQLQWDLINGRETFSYPVIVRGRTKTYVFEKAGEEVLKTPLGPIKTIKMRRDREDSERETVLWLAPELDYLLVKLWQREDDEDFQINLEHGTINGEKLAKLLSNKR